MNRVLLNFDLSQQLLKEHYFARVAEKQSLQQAEKKKDKHFSR